MEILLAAITQAIAILIFEDIVEQPLFSNLRNKLRGDPRTRALLESIDCSYIIFSEKYPDLIACLFDQHFIKNPAVITELSKFLVPQKSPNPDVLIELWQNQFGSPPNVNISEVVEYFFSIFFQALCNQIELLPLINTRALDKLHLIAIETQNQTQVLQEIRSYLFTYLMLMYPNFRKLDNFEQNSFGKIELQIEGHIENFSEQMEMTVTYLLSALFGVSHNQVEITKVNSGSILMEYLIPTSFYNLLINIAKYRQFVFQTLSITSIYVENEKFKLEMINEMSDSLAAYQALKGYLSKLVGNYEDALNFYNKALLLKPNNPLFLNCRSEIHLIKHNFEDAISDLNKSDSLIEHYTLSYANRGNVHRLLGENSEAIDLFEIAIENDPKYYWFFSHRGESYRVMGEYGLALSDLDQALLLYPYDSWALTSRGEVKRSLSGNIDEAISDFNEAIELMPNNYWAFALLGKLFFELGDNASALEKLNQAIKLNPEHSWAYQIRGNVYLRLRMDIEAEADFRLSRQLDSDKEYVMV